MSGTSGIRKGDSLREARIRNYTCGLAVTIIGLGMYSFYVRELLASLALFSLGFLFLALIALSVFLIWCASVQVGIWARPASRNMMALSRRMISASGKS
jgi:hypothetical protein